MFSLSHSKSGDMIEPVLKPQWWVNCKPLAEEVIRVRLPFFRLQPFSLTLPFQRTRAGELEINPKQSENEWYRWLENIQDWCISRQLWWGHRCPAYFVRIQGEEQDVNDGKYWVVGRSREQALERAEVVASGRQFDLEQDEDVLDTWFSSGLWPFSIMGWPEKVFFFFPLFLLTDSWGIGCRRLIYPNSIPQASSKQAGISSSSG